jgi:hypothetical protein
MNRILQRLTNSVVHGFAGSGVEIDDNGQLCLPDGLCPDRVHRFIELVMDQRFASPRDAMHTLFVRVGVDRKTVGLLDQILGQQGEVELGEAAAHARGLLGSLSDLKRIPARIRDFLVVDLGLAAERCEDLESAVRSTRVRAAERLGCEASWDAILGEREAVVDLTRPWRESTAAA